MKDLNENETQMENKINILNNKLMEVTASMEHKAAKL